MAIWQVRPQGQALIALLPAFFHLALQVVTLKKDGSNALAHFRANKVTGLLVALACLVVGVTS
jgi:4-hydroxybenzoate polyprenyltransferase